METTKTPIIQVFITTENVASFIKGEGFSPELSLVGYDGLDEDEQQEVIAKLNDLINLLLNGRLNQLADAIGADANEGLNV